MSQAQHVSTLVLLISVITVFGALAAYPPPQFSDHEASGQVPPLVLDGVLPSQTFDVASADNTLNSIISARLLSSSLKGSGSVPVPELPNLTYTFPNNGVSTTPGSSNTITFDTSEQASIVAGHLRYTIQDPSFSGTDSFTWTVSHTDGSQSTGSIAVRVAKAPPPPLLAGGLLNREETVTSADNTLNNVISSKFLGSSIFKASFPTAEYSDLTFTFPNNGVSTTTGSSNTITFDTSTQAGIVLGHLRYTIQDPSFSGVDTFTWTISHSDGRQAAGNINVTVAEAVPLAGGLLNREETVTSADNTLNNVISSKFLGSSIFKASFPTAEYSDLTFTFPNNGVSTTPGSSNTITFDTSEQASIVLGHLRYTIQDPSFSGVDTFTWTISHSDGRQAAGNINVTVAEAAPIPLILSGNLRTQSITVASNENTLNNVISLRILGSALAATGSIPNAEFPNLTYTFPNNGVSTTTGSSNTIAFDTSTQAGTIAGHLRYTIQDPSFSGVDTFTWTVSHSDGSQTTGSISVTVAAPPLLAGGLLNREETVTSADNTLNNVISSKFLGSSIFKASFPTAEYSDLTFTFPNNGVSTTPGSSNTITFDTSEQASIVLGHLRYTIQDPSFSGVDTFTWTISHSDGRQAAGNINVTVAEAPLLAGGLQTKGDIPVTSDQNTLNNIISSQVFTATFLSETITLAELSNLTYTFSNNGVSTTPGSSNTITFDTSTQSENGLVIGHLRYTIQDPSFSGDDTFRLIVTHSDGRQAAGSITVAVAEATLTTRAITPDTVPQGEAGALSFTGAIFDGNPVDVLDVGVTVTITAASISTPSVNITGLLTPINTDDFTANNDDTIITINAQQVSYTINDDAPAGSHTFTYTVTSDGEPPSSSTITIEIPEVSLTCDSNIDENFELGQIGIGSISKVGTMVVSNTGGLVITALAMSADPWMGDIDGTSTPVINAGQTHYSFNLTDSYANRTPFTVTPMNATASISADAPLQVYVQVIPILNSPHESFRGMINQTVTITSSC